MTPTQLRDQLHKQIDALPDDVVEQIADFTMFMMARRRMALSYEDWSAEQWQRFALEQFFRIEEDDVTYTLEDAKEVFHP